MAPCWPSMHPSLPTHPGQFIPPPSLPPPPPHSLPPYLPHSLPHSLTHSLSHSLPLSLSPYLPLSYPPLLSNYSQTPPLYKEKTFIGCTYILCNINHMIVMYLPFLYTSHVAYLWLSKNQEICYFTHKHTENSGHTRLDMYVHTTLLVFGAGILIS